MHHELYNSFGFQTIEIDATDKLAKIIIQLVKNMVVNVCEITTSHGRKVATPKHMQLLLEMQKKCVQKGGAVLMPEEWFSGKLSSNYTDANSVGHVKLDIADNSAFVRPEHPMKGGATTDDDFNQIINMVLSNNKFTCKVSTEVKALLRSSLIENIGLLFNCIRVSFPRSKNISVKMIEFVISRKRELVHMKVA